jgi:hypothetical protein
MADFEKDFENEFPEFVKKASKNHISRNIAPNLVKQI